jgi:hypothetical protein
MRGKPVSVNVSETNSRPKTLLPRPWRPVLERMRKSLRELTAGPLTSRRFNP